MHYNNPNENRSVLAALRSVVPIREVTFSEAKRVAELQANRLLALFDITDGPVPSEVVSELPRVQVVRTELTVSGASEWRGGNWVILLNQHEAWVRQRFTLMHEFKHIIDHGRAELLYTGDRLRTGNEQAEAVADYFAGCVLASKRFLKSAFGHGVQTPVRVARHFDISLLAASVRLEQTGLSVVHDREAQPASGYQNRGRARYQRQLAPVGMYP